MRFSKWRFGVEPPVLRVDARRRPARRALPRPGSLGSYRIAYRLANLPTTEIVSVLESVAFPALAVRARESREWAIATYPRYLTLTCGLAGPLAAVFAALAQPIVAALLGPRVRSRRGAAGDHVRRRLPAGADQHRRVARAQPRPARARHGDGCRAGHRAGRSGSSRSAPHGVVGAAVASLLSLVVTVPMWVLQPVPGAGPARGTPSRIAVGRLPAALAAGDGRGPSPTCRGRRWRCVVVGSTAGFLAWVVAVIVLDRPPRRAELP